MSAAGPDRGLKQSFAGDWARAARYCLGLLACLAQLSAPAQAGHPPAIAAHSIIHKAGADAAAGVASASVAAAHSGVPCALHAARAGPDKGTSSPAPCPNGDCPFCPCPCCAPLHAAFGILPQEMSRATYASSFSEIALPPTRLGSPLRFAVIAGQPRAPPVLI